MKKQQYRTRYLQETYITRGSYVEYIKALKKLIKDNFIFKIGSHLNGCFARVHPNVHDRDENVFNIMSHHEMQIKATMKYTIMINFSGN